MCDRWSAVSAVAALLLTAALLLAAALLLLASRAAGQSPADGQSPATAESPDSLRSYVLDEVEVRGRPWSLPGEGLAFASSVIDGRALTRAGVLGLADALAPLPGVRVVRLGAAGTFNAISLRGTRNEQVLVLVDGRRLSPAQGGGVDLGAIDPGVLERVDVLRGGASALHGAGALGGVINLVTRPIRGHADLTRVRVEGGSFGTLAGALRHERQAGDRARVWMSGHALRTRGDYSYVDRGVERERANAGARGSGGAMGLERRPGASGLGFTIDGALEAGDQDVPGTIEFPTPKAQRSDRRAVIGGEIVTERHDSRVRLAASAHALRQRRSYTDPLNGIDDRHVNRSNAFEIRADLAQKPHRSEAALERATLLHATLEGHHDALASTSDGDRQRRSAGLVLRGQRAHGRILVAPAARFDARSDGSPFLSPRIALRVDLPRRAHLRLATGRSFRPPSFDDLFFPDVGGAAGNPALRAERAFDVEMGAGIQFDHSRETARRTSLTASVYAQRIDDLIQWAPGPDGRWRPHNVGMAVIRGLEIEGRATRELMRTSRPARLTATLDLLDPRNRTGEPNVDGRRLPYRPAVEGYVELALPLAARLDVIAAWHGVGRSFVTEANTKSIPGHGLVDVTFETLLAGKSAPHRIVASLAVLNLTDVEAVDVRDYPLPGREWRLALCFAAPEMP